MFFGNRFRHFSPLNCRLAIELIHPENHTVLELTGATAGPDGGLHFGLCLPHDFLGTNR